MSKSRPYAILLLGSNINFALYYAFDKAERSGYIDEQRTTDLKFSALIPAFATPMLVTRRIPTQVLVRTAMIGAVPCTVGSGMKIYEWIRNGHQKGKEEWKAVMDVWRTLRETGP